MLCQRSMKSKQIKVIFIKYDIKVGAIKTTAEQ